MNRPNPDTSVRQQEKREKDHSSPASPTRTEIQTKQAIEMLVSLDETLNQLINL
jgi:hypothetical protein